MGPQSNDIIWDEVRKEIEEQHSKICPADPELPADIYIGETVNVEGLKDDEFEVYAECQNCLKGGWTVLKDDPKYHKPHAVMPIKAGSSGYVKKPIN